MPTFDLVLRGGKVVNHGGTVEADVAIQGEVVAAIVRPGTELQARETIDVGGKRLFPGAIDPHCHITDRRPIKDACTWETPSMVLGGTTTILEFLKTEDSYHVEAPAAIDEIDRWSYVDVGFHSVVQNERHVDELEACAERYGMTSVKMYMGAGAFRLYPNTVAIDDGLVYRTLERMAALGPTAQAMVHAENWEITRLLRARLEASGRTDAAAWTESRPSLVEIECLIRIALFAQNTGCSVYAVHLSAKESPQILRKFRALGVTIYGETCPQYLMIHQDHELAWLARAHPAVKGRADNEALWDAVIDGVIDCVGSDHLPMRLADKQLLRQSIWAPRGGGVPGSGTILPLMLSEGIAKRGLTPERVAAVTSYNAARIFGLFPRKGQIAIGADADIVVSDPGRKVTVRPELLGLDFTFFDGQEFIGWPELTLLRGQVVARDAQLQVQSGTGRYLKRALAGSALP